MTHIYHVIVVINYHYIDVNNPEIITKQFSKVNKKFDIIIDDSTHEFEHQINIIKNTHKYLKEGGHLVIEDIYRFKKGHEESRYFEKLKVGCQFTYTIVLDSIIDCL